MIALKPRLMTYMDEEPFILAHNRRFPKKNCVAAILNGLLNNHLSKTDQIFDIVIKGRLRTAETGFGTVTRRNAPTIC